MRKGNIIKSVISFILIMFTFPIKLNTTATALFDVTDSKSNINYHITQNDDTLLIENDTFSLKLFIPDTLLNVLCYDSKFAFLCATEVSPHTYLYKISEYNLNTGYLNSIKTDIAVSVNHNEFYTDCKGVYYIPDNIDSKSIYAVTSTSTSTITSPAAIYQMLNTNEGDFLVFTTKGTYSLINQNLTFISDLIPATPCVYSGDSIITDAKNRKYQFANNCFSELTQHSEDISSSDSIESTTDSPIIINENSITIPPSTTFAKLYKYLNIEKHELKILKQNSDIITSGKLGTGMIAEFHDKSYYLIVSGDLTGEGNINSRDIKSLMKHLTDEALLKEPYLSAADIYSDGSIDTKDLLQLSKLY